jgi:hypothetical protein
MDMSEYLVSRHSILLAPVLQAKKWIKGEIGSEMGSNVVIVAVNAARAAVAPIHRPCSAGYVPA